jgi:hypothetical protein
VEEIVLLRDAPARLQCAPRGCVERHCEALQAEPNSPGEDWGMLPENSVALRAWWGMIMEDATWTTGAGDGQG